MPPNLRRNLSSRHSWLAWARLHGSVSRGTQRPDSNIDIMAGYSHNANYFIIVENNISETGVSEHEITTLHVIFKVITIASILVRVSKCRVRESTKFKGDIVGEELAARGVEVIDKDIVHRIDIHSARHTDLSNLTWRLH